VEVVVASVAVRRPVALEAQVVAVSYPLDAVLVVAVAAANAAGVHLALHERPVDVDLVEDLAVGKVHAFAQKLRDPVVEEIGVAMDVVVQRHAPGKVWVISYSPIFPSGPWVWTKYLPSFR